MGARRLKDMRSWQLAVLGALALSGTSLAITLLATVWPLHVEAMRAHALSWTGLHAAWMAAAVAAPGLMFAAVARRCGQLLYQRHLD